jgi:hypothetical protein
VKTGPMKPGNSDIVQRLEPHLCPEHQEQECEGEPVPCQKCRPKEREDP